MKFISRDYFPSMPNTKYIYKGFKNTFLNFIRYEDFSNESKIQIRFSNNNSDFVNVYEYTPSGVKLMISENNVNYRENILNENTNVNNFIIKDPIKEGATWFLSDGSKRTITNINAKVNTIYKYFPSALEITTISKDNHISIDYYVKDIGLVKSIYYIQNLALLSSELEDIITDTPLTQKIKIFYPDKNFNSIWFSEENLDFYTNDSNNFSFSKSFETPPKGLIPILNKNVLINDLHFDFKEKIIYIDFSNNFLNILKLNKDNEALFLQAISETLKNYYCSNKIIMTIEKKPCLLTFKNNALMEFYNNPIKESRHWRISDCKFPLTYVVKKGDSLVSIADEFETTYEKLAKLNKIKNPNILILNQVLQIFSSGIYTIKPKDTLQSIAKRFGLSYEDLIDLNNISDLSLIKPGIKLRLC